jgi:hypothetical protein
MNPKYPVYIVSKGRWKSRLTAKALMKRNIPFHIVIEPQEYEQYAAVIPAEKILVLPFSNLGQGSIPARNWIWEHALSTGARRHWILDDNIRSFFVFHRNRFYETKDGVTFRAIEEWVDVHENVVIAGPQYEMFVSRVERVPAITLNTRVYSCILIDNSIPYRWRGRYNEDTDLCLRVLKDGYCTALFNIFPAKKAETMSMRGGNTDELYQGNGRLIMALSLMQQHPDVVDVSFKWGRYQHKVDYSRFANNRPILKAKVNAPRIKLYHEDGSFEVICAKDDWCCNTACDQHGTG